MREPQGLQPLGFFGGECRPLDRVSLGPATAFGFDRKPLRGDSIAFQARNFDHLTRRSDAQPVAAGFPAAPRGGYFSGAARAAAISRSNAPITSPDARHFPSSTLICRVITPSAMSLASLAAFKSSKSYDFACSKNRST